MLSTLLALASASLLPLTLAQNSSFSNLVTFGDSYTDTISVGDGGAAWPIYAASYSNSTLYPYARSGATCSNNITERPFPSVFESQLPTFFQETENGTVTGLEADETLYSLWIGTNDVGAYALLTGSSAGNLDEATKCMVDWVRALYEGPAGARNFLFQNMIPLNQAPMYAPDAYLSKFYAVPHNTSAASAFISELATAGNALTRLRLQNLVATLPGAHVAYFDSYALFDDIYNNPASYLNGTAPLNVTGAVNTCVYNDDGELQGECVLVNGTDRDSYMWFDELHPSEQVDRIVAQEVARVLDGEGSEWVEWLS